VYVPDTMLVRVADPLNTTSEFIGIWMRSIKGITRGINNEGTILGVLD